MASPLAPILVVDDDALNRDLLCRRLIRSGYAVHAVASGQEALTYLASHTVELVLLDVQMPEMSGLEVLQSIRRNPTTPHLPVLMVTAKDQSEDIVTALDLGADDYITKPIDFPVALARIGTQISRKQLEARAHLSEERYALVQAFLDGLWDWKPSTDEIYFSMRWKAILGYEDDDLANRPEEWFNRVHPEDLPRLQRDIKAHLAGQTAHLESEYRMQHRSGAYRWVLTQGLAVRDRNGTAIRVAGSQADITDRKVVDALTGLPNRMVLLDRLDRLLQQRRQHGGGQFAAFFLDLDGFKFINDSMGHHAGDQLLQAFARRLEGSLRTTDVVARVASGQHPAGQDAGEHTLARIGGDEFIILLHEVRSAVDALRVAERVQQALHYPFQVDERDVFTSASIGIAVGPAGYTAADEVLRDADTAMYRAKALGKGKSEVFSVAMREQALQRIQLDTAVRQGLERNEFLPYFQPIIDMRTGGLAGFEALLRWRHPSRGIVPPADFIQVIEENGLLLPIGRRFLRDVCSQLRRWQDAYPAARRLWINVNFSSQQFLEAGLPAQLVESLEASGLDPHHLVVEITERTAIGNFSLTADVLEQLRRTGIRVVLDDFGTGYSSLACLHQLPISGLKLDQIFINGEGQRPEILRAIVSIANCLKLSMTAEGVETAEQASYLRALGCDFAQGYFFAHPLDAHAAGRFITAGAVWLPDAALVEG